MTSARKPTLAALRREARRVFGRGTVTWIQPEQYTLKWWRAGAIDVAGLRDIELCEATEAEARVALMRCLRALPAQPTKRKRGGR